ncbi:UNVERIFIED_CONTAM: putative mitochondrial protein [Sesamum radiatum]|uniref:Mitochondrial protein n=1 Tax=Sesamum radiatum TaxID=300843 RepID=A0AAW2SLA1_SESRA
MSSLAKQISVPIFSGQNYDYWAIKMKTYFQSQKLWEIVEEGVTLPEESSTSSSAEKGKLENKKAKDSEALYYIQTAVADHIFPRISIATSAKEAWSILQKEYQGSAKVRIIKLQTLRRDFENMKMKDSETIDEYYTKVRELVNQLKAYGEDIPEKRIVEKLLISVTEKYDPIVTTIEETKDITTLTVTELVGSLEAYEKRRSRREENSLENAFQSKLNMRSQNFNKKEENFKSTLGDKKKQNVRPCRICKRINHLEKDCYFRGKPQCRNCKRFGHVEKDCRLKGNHQANCIEENNSSDQLFYTCNSVAETGEATWYIDSAASNHMTYNKGAFQTLDESFKTNVKLGDNHIVKVEGKGSVAINTRKGTRIINDVMYIPNLRTNLFSVGQMMEKGYTLHFGGDSCTIYDNKDKTLKIAEVRMKEHRCFPIHLHYMGRTAMKAQEDQSWLWHRRLDHFNFQGLKILHQKKIMTDLPQIQAVKGACEACLQGKQHKKPFPSGTSWRAKAVLELIHTDVCGPMRTPSHEQNRYFILFIDDYSRMTWVYFMREKSEVFKVFKKFKNLVEKQSVMIPKEIPPQQQQEEGTDQAEMERRSQQAPGSPRRPPPLEEIEEETPPRRTKLLSDIYETCNFIMLEPENFETAVKHKVWVQAMEEEIKMIEKNNTWELTDRPKDKEVIGVKWIYKTKLNADGSIQKHKARLVAKGYSQLPGIDYTETFAPVARLDTIRALIAIAANKK